MSFVAGTLTHELHNVFIRKRKKDSTAPYQVILENQTPVVTFYKLRDRLLTYCSRFLFFRINHLTKLLQNENTEKVRMEESFQVSSVQLY